MFSTQQGELGMWYLFDRLRTVCQNTFYHNREVHFWFLFLLFTAMVTTHRCWIFPVPIKMRFSSLVLFKAVSYIVCVFLNAKPLLYYWESIFCNRIFFYVARRVCWCLALNSLYLCLWMKVALDVSVFAVTSVALCLCLCLKSLYNLGIFSSFSVWQNSLLKLSGPGASLMGKILIIISIF